MIYETAVLAKAEVTEDKLQAVKNLVSSVVQEFEGEVLIHEDWGVRSFPQPMAGGKHKGHYLYFMYKAKSGINLELERKLGISEEVIRSMIIKLGDDSEQAGFLKAYTNPFAR